MESFLNLALVTLVAAFVGSYLAGYLRKKGENLATHEDLDKLVTQVTAVTETTKAVEARYAQELEQFRARLERSVFITRAQFETEFDAYKKVFEALGPVRLAMGGTRPMMSVSRKGETGEDKLRALADRLHDLIDAQNKAVTVVENLLPFFPTDIYRTIRECLNASAMEILDLQTGGESTFTFDWFEQGAKRMDAFLEAYNKVADMMRDRISMLAILPRG